MITTILLSFPLIHYHYSKKTGKLQEKNCFFILFFLQHQEMFTKQGYNEDNQSPKGAKQEDYDVW